MNGTSLAPQIEKLDQLKKILPETFTEGKIDWEKLKAALGEDINFSNERYVLNWAGKSEAFKAIKTPTTKTLNPAREESVNFEDTENVFIEGENLEVLKILQKSYFGKVKMIYIDPPYNTGNDSFIYPDKFSETKEEYQKRVGDKDEEGYATKEGNFSRNSKENGQYHSNWLNMMYPRLFLAKNLLREDGVIFVSIDDNEVHNLRLVMNEIFGEENFVASIIWQKKYSVSNDDPGIAAMHDYIICFQKSNKFNRRLLPRTEKQKSRYKNLDNDPRGSWASAEYVSSKSRTERPTLWYPIKHPGTGQEVWPDERAVWRYSREKHLKMEAENRLYWGPSGEYEKPRLKRFLSEVQGGVVPNTWWEFKEVGHNDEGQKETGRILGKKVFSTPKPVRLLKRILQISTSKSDLVLDFFSGSGAFAQAVLELNQEEEENKRKFICVQLPEKTEENSEAFKAGYKTIADIAKERIRRAAKKIEEELNAEKQKKKGELEFEEESSSPLPDLGFKVFKLADSNFKQWRQIKKHDTTALEEQMELFIDPVGEYASIKNMVHELLLKSGKDLNSNITEKEGFISIDNGELVLVLEKANQDIFTWVLKEAPQKVIALDRLFEGNDQLKTNTALQMKDAGVEFKTI